MRLKGHVALVTGSGQGIGREIAVRLAHEGANVIIKGLHDDADSAETLELVRAEGADGCVLAGDASGVRDVRRVVAEGISRMGRIDVLVNNASISSCVPLLDVSQDGYDAAIESHLESALIVDGELPPDDRAGQRGSE